LKKCLKSTCPCPTRSCGRPRQPDSDRLRTTEADGRVEQAARNSARSPLPLARASRLQEPSAKVVPLRGPIGAKVDRRSSCCMPRFAGVGHCLRECRQLLLARGEAAAGRSQFAPPGRGSRADHSTTADRERAALIGRARGGVASPNLALSCCDTSTRIGRTGAVPRRNRD